MAVLKPSSIVGRRVSRLVHLSLAVMLIAAGCVLPVRADGPSADEPVNMVGQEAAPMATAATIDGNYILGAGDEISVEDVTMGKLTTGQTKVLADGSVDLPLIGEVNLAGMSLDEAQALLNEKFKGYYVNPGINIQVLYQHPIRVYVEGAVNSPGMYVSGKNTKPANSEKFELGSSNLHYFFYQFYLTDALILAGGLKPTADLKDIRIIRTYPRPQTIHVNLWELLKSGAIIQDLPLREHDIIQIATLPKDALVNNDDWKMVAKTNISQSLFNVNVIGAVKQPGSYRISSADNPLTAIAQAGGFSEKADQKSVFVLRTNAAGQVFKKRLDVSDPQLTGKGPKSKTDENWVSLLPEDVIFVDESASKKAMTFGKSLFDKAAGSAMLPFFSELLKTQGK